MVPFHEKRPTKGRCELLHETRRGRIAAVTRLHDEEHGHTQGGVDPTIATSERGIWAIKWSFLGLVATALVQLAVVLLSGSVALLSDTIHNFGDAATAIPLGVAFALTRLGASRRFTFGYGRAEDLAGVLVVLIILFSAVVAGYAGLLIAAALLVIVWQSGKAVFTRMLDRVEPEVVEEMRHAACEVPGVEEVAEIRARWLGHRLHAEVNVAVDPGLSVAEGHAIAREVNHRMLHHLGYLSGAVVHVDPIQEAGEEHHRIPAHSHDGLPTHSH
jgi:divalent metal cation (Fe/Co/Zn/Cd) transporter